VITARVGLAMTAVRTWTRFYTWGLPAELRDARRDEIESDLWESFQDARGDAALAWQIWARLFGGVADDLWWRLDQATSLPLFALRFAATLGLIAMLGLWLISATSTRLPDPPAAPRFPRLIDAPPPPPPPPPPCAPPGFPSAGSSPSNPGVTCTR
jgi:hypothetical protein